MPNYGDLVPSDEWLYRRFYANKPKHLTTESGGVNSRIFKPRATDNGMLSVNAKSLTTYEQSIEDEDAWALFEIQNSDVIRLELKTIHDPTPNEHTQKVNPAHCLIIRIDEDDDITPKQLAEKARRVYRQL